MGYRRNRKVYKLTYEAYSGLEIMARSVPVGDLLDIMQMVTEMGKKPTRAHVGKLFGAFAGQIESWTYEDEDGKPLPPTAETLLAEDDFGFVVALINGWVQAVTGADPTKAAAGKAAEVEASIPMSPGM